MYAALETIKKITITVSYDRKFSVVTETYHRTEQKWQWSCVGPTNTSLTIGSRKIAQASSHCMQERAGIGPALFQKKYDCTKGNVKL